MRARTTMNTRLWYRKNGHWCDFYDPLLKIYHIHYNASKFNGVLDLSVDTDISIFENRAVCITDWNESGDPKIFENNIIVFEFSSVLIFEAGYIEYLVGIEDVILFKQYEIIGKMI